MNETPGSGTNAKQRALRLFEQALELAPGERDGFLADACSGDSVLLRQVESLLATVEQAEDFLTVGAPDSLSTDDMTGSDTDWLGDAGERQRLKPGFVLNQRYRVTATLGAGGMGEVYRAVDGRLDRDVAIKVLSAHGLHNKEMQERFDREVKAVASLTHPNVVMLYDIVEQRGVVFAIMELVEGKTLRQLIADGVELSTALRITEGVAAGLASAHEHDLMHRDIKPENVILSHSGQVKILDFGLARREQQAEDQFLTRSSLTPGTIPYMSPEQVDNKQLTCATDIFSLGTVVYEMFAGFNPFRGDSVLETMRRVSEAAPLALTNTAKETPAELHSLVEAMLRRTPSQRPSAAEVSERAQRLQPTGSRSGTPRRGVVASNDSTHIDPTSTPTNLPRRLVKLVGRDDQQRVMAARVRDEPLVTLVGTGGVGKTSLALAVARELLPEYPGGVWFCEFAAARASEQVLATVIGAVNSVSGSVSSLEELVSLLQAQPTLLLFDNCEHVIDSVAELVESLLEKSPELTILATSREPLDVPGESVRRIAGLECDGAESDAVELFVRRAAASGDYKNNPDDRPLVEKIVSRLEGLPLAIELAAPKLGVMTLRELLEALDDQAVTLRTGRRSRDRQSAIDQTISWSFDLLGPEEQETLLALSVFTSWFTSKAATDVSGLGPEASIHLSRLVEQSVVVRKEDHGRSRYRLLQPIRQFCQTRLEPDRLLAIRERHARYFAQRAIEKLSLGISGYDEHERLHALNVEWPDLRQAVAWGRKHSVAEVAIEPCVALARTAFFQMRLELFDWLLAAEDSMDDAIAGDAGALATIAWGHWHRSRPDEAKKYHQGLEAAPPTLFSRWSDAYLLFYFGEYQASVERWREYRHLAEASGVESEQRWARCSIESLPQLFLESESPRVDEIMEIANRQQTEEDWLTGGALYLDCRAIVAMRRGDHAKARSLAALTIEAAREAGARYLELAMTGLYASLSVTPDGGDTLESLRAAVDAYRELLEFNKPSLLPIATRGLVTALAAHGAAEAAAQGAMLAEDLRGVGDQNEFTTEYPSTIDQLRHELGEERFAELREEGRRLTAEDLLAIAKHASGSPSADA